MNGEADALFDVFGNAPRAVIRRGVYAGTTGGFPLVDMGDSRFVCDWGSGYVPVLGETVQIVTINDRHMLFPSKALPGTGTVMTVSPPLVSVQTSVGTVSLPYIGTAPTSGQTVGIQWSDIAHVTGVLSTSPKPPDPVPNPGGGAELRSATFQAIDTGSHNTGSANYWQAQPWASDSTLGGWFYGTQIADTIPAAASFVSLEFFVSWASRFGASPNFGLHGLAGKTAQLSFTNVAAWNPDGGWQTPPDPGAWFAALKAGGGRLGVGLNHGGFNKFSSRAQDAMTGALRISWRS